MVLPAQFSQYRTVCFEKVELDPDGVVSYWKKDKEVPDGHWKPQMFQANGVFFNKDISVFSISKFYTKKSWNHYIIFFHSCFFFWTQHLYIYIKSKPFSWTTFFFIPQTSNEDNEITVAGSRPRLGIPSVEPRSDGRSDGRRLVTGWMGETEVAPTSWLAPSMTGDMMKWRRIGWENCQ